MQSISYYVNPNTRGLTSNYKNTIIKDKEVYNDAMSQHLLNPIEDLVQALETPAELANSEAQTAWQEALEETGVNPFQTDLTSTLTQLSVEQDFLTGGNDNIFGETIESCLSAINKVLERIENPLAAVTEERAAYLQQEKEFYQNFLEKLKQLPKE